MNKVEGLKAERDGLEVGASIEQYAREGWEAIPDDDRDMRLKWWGIFYRKQTPGLFMIRIRIPNGIATAEQIRAIGEIARDLGGDTLDLTTRQQVQLRNVRIEDVPAILDRLREVGLITLQTGADNIRNVVGCPVAGLTPNELFDASPAAREFTEIFVGNPAFTNLPRKFNVTITGCLENCAHTETQDVALVPASKQVDGRLVPGFNVLVGGKMGSGGYRVATPLDVFVGLDDAAAVAAELALIFRDHGSREARNRVRFAFLVEEWGEQRLRRELERRLKRSFLTAGVDARQKGSTDHIGVWRQRGDRSSYVGLLVPVGRATGRQFVELARLSEVYGGGEVRLTTTQNVILTNVTDAALPKLLEQPLLKQLRYNPTQVARGTVSCTGKDYCSMALIETKTYALELAKALGDVAPARPISVNWSGCPAGCGNHQASDIGLLGRQTRINGEVVDAVDIFLGGSSGPDAGPGVKVMKNVPCTELPRIAEMLVRYGDFKELNSQLSALQAAPRIVPVEISSAAS